METKPILLPEQDLNFHIDFPLLRDILRRKAATLALVGLVVGGGYALRQLYSAPQQFMSECSVAMQQSGPVGIPSGLSALLGGAGGGSHKYMGLLASRMMAEKVERRLDLAQRLRLSSRKEAVNLLRNGMKPDDSSFEGLLIIHFVMEAPPVKAPGSERKAEQVRQLVAEVANEYADELADFYSESNSEGANALLKIVQNERRDARENYQRATTRLRNFVFSWKDKPVTSTPVGNNIESNGPDYLFSLYNQIDQIDADMRATLVAQEASKKLHAEQVKNIPILPAEDSLLNSARSRLSAAESNFKRVSDAYNPEARAYQEAEDNVRHAKEDLAQQLKGIQKLQTTDQMDTRKQLDVQKDRRASLVKLATKAESNLFSRRDLAWRMEQLRTDQGIAQQRMQAAEVKAVDVRLSTLTGKSKISILDDALPPDTNMQGNSSPARASILIALFAMALVTAFEYMRGLRRQSLNAYQFALSTGGYGGNGMTNGAHSNGNGNGNGHHAAENGNGATAQNVPEETHSTNGNGNGNGSNGNGKNGVKTPDAKVTRRR